jgi:hypothetical protein
LEGKCLIAAFLISFLFITGLAAAQYSLEDNISINLAQSIDGTGFFSSYRNVNMPDPLGNLQGAAGQDFSGMAAKHLAHGSGKIGENSRILAFSYYNETSIVPVQDGVELEPVIDEENITALPSIAIQEDTSMLYSPSAMALGRGFYARNPISRMSLPEDRTCIKNLDTGSILDNEIEYAKALRKELDAHADFIDLANTSMELNETITDGMVRIRALQLEGLPTFGDMVVEKASEEQWDEEGEPEMVPVLLIKKSKPIIETDEMYVGSFHIKKRLIFAASVNGNEEVDEWLPCCYQGIEYSKGLDREDRSIDEIFDCTCYKALNEMKPPK